MFDLNRLSNLFDPNLLQPQNQQPSPNMPNGPVGQMDIGMGDDELQQQLMRLLSPQDEQYDRFAQLISSIPQRQNYQPGKMRKVGAFLGGLGAGGPVGISGGQPIGYKSNLEEGLKIQDHILNEPYDKALSDWSNTAKPTLEAARLENTRNVNSRITGGNLMTAEKNRKELKRKEDRDAQIMFKENEDLDRKREELKVRQQRAATYAYRVEHPNHKFIETNGFIYSVDPISNKTEQLKDADGEPIESSKMGDEEKINLQLKNSKELENLRQTGRTSLEGTRQENRAEIEETRQGNRRELVKDRAEVKSTVKAETPQAKQVRLYNKAVEGLNKNPAWREYLKVNDLRKTFDIQTPKGKSSLFSKDKPGGDPLITKAITDYIYGEEAPKPEKKSEDKKIPDSEARIVITNGTKNFSLPSSQVDAYIKLHPEFKRK